MHQSSSTDTTRTTFDVALPWFNHERWMWSFDLEGKSGPAYRRIRPPADAKGVLAVYFAGCGDERHRELMRWLIARFNPAYIVPPPLQFPKWTGDRHGGHNSAWR
jgi:hypothetical protein